MQQKSTLKLILLIITLLLLVSVFSPCVVGDGCAFIRKPSVITWATMPQENQIGIINYQNGYEKLILVISMKNRSLDGDKAVWIFPVPADPEEVTIDILDRVPSLRGTDLDQIARDAVLNPYSFVYLTQPYLPVFLVYYYVATLMSGASRDQYRIYEHIEEMGVITEKMGAENSEAFQAYLQSNNLSLPEEANVTIDDYIGQEYCFIVSWISDVEEFRKYAQITEYEYYYYDYYYYDEPFYLLGVSINFPVDRIYYPLKLTSVYGRETIPIYIQVLDFVTPSSYPDVSKDGFIQTDYYIDRYYAVPLNLTTFFSEQIQQAGVKNQYDSTYHLENLRYTEIEIHTRAQYLTDDLWIDEAAPGDVAALDFTASYGWLIVVLVFIFISCVASLLAGLLVYYKQKPSLPKFALLGLILLCGLHRSMENY